MPKSPCRTVALFDSGIGGLTVYREMRRNFPAFRYLYFGDTGRVPYGNKSKATICRYAEQVSRFLLAQRADLLIVACNTASALALPHLQSRFDIPIVGVIGPGVEEALRVTKNGRIGVIGTTSTISSGTYEDALQASNKEVVILSQPCPLFVPLAEEGWVDNVVADECARLYLEPFLSADIDTLILGCTHYPLLAETIQRAVGGQVRLIESGKAVATSLEPSLERAAPAAAAPPPIFYVTDSPGRFQAVGRRFLGESIETLELIQLGD